MNLFIQLIHLLLTQNNPNALLQTAAGGYRSHTIHTLQFRQNLRIYKTGQLRCAVHIFIFHTSNHNRHHVRINLHDNGTADQIIRPCRLQLIQTLPHIQRCRIHIGSFSKFQNNQRVILIGYGRYILNVTNGGHGFLNGNRHRTFHLFRTGARVCSNYNRIGQFHTGKEVCCHPGK